VVSFAAFAWKADFQRSGCEPWNLLKSIPIQDVVVNPFLSKSFPKAFAVLRIYQLMPVTV
jgi:hypothetical protein